MFKQTLITAVTVLALTAGTAAYADKYVIDTKGAHASIQFKISHLGYSWIYGRFNRFSGEFEYNEEQPAASKVAVEIDTASIDSNHAERDKHLRSDDFLDVSKYPKATFVSTGYEDQGDGKALLKGDFTLHGVTRPIVIEVRHIGAGDDPWGGFRRGFEGTTQVALKDYDIGFNLGPTSTSAEIILTVEGVRQ
ncbi:MAG: YceI family protein [Gammaproteobacteria bacterium]|nr:YceI family protein [Gammaproteobacteria bacterium]